MFFGLILSGYLILHYFINRLISIIIFINISFILVCYFLFVREEDKIWYLMYKIFIQLKFPEEKKKYENTKPIFDNTDIKRQVG